MSTETIVKIVDVCVCIIVIACTFVTLYALFRLKKSSPFLQTPRVIGWVACIVLYAIMSGMFWEAHRVLITKPTTTQNK